LREARTSFQDKTGDEAANSMRGDTDVDQHSYDTLFRPSTHDLEIVIKIAINKIVESKY